jgi:hypothetical protein
MEYSMTKYQSENLKYFLILYKVVFYGSLFKKKELFFIQLLIAKNSTKYFLKKIYFFNVFGFIYWIFF